MRGTFIILCFLAFLSVTDCLANQFQGGLKAYNNSDFEEAYAIWKPLATNGDRVAQFSSGSSPAQFPEQDEDGHWEEELIIYA